MRRKKRNEEIELDQVETLRPSERHNFCLIGLISDEVVDLGKLFFKGDRDKISATLMEAAGFPWSRAFDDAWDKEGESEARARGLFDLIWHRRAVAKDPVVNAPDFTGFDVLMTITRQASPGLAELLVKIDGNDASNPRRDDGPEWWDVWHKGTRSRPGGWLNVEEVTEIHKGWRDIATPEIEEACLTIMGVPFTHQGCWGLMEDFGGFFAQCSSEKRAVIAEVDL